jgi:predicted acylesterase/phospholipase RssA
MDSNMNQAHEAPNKLGRRQVLTGIAASALSACTTQTKPIFVTRLETDVDPLANFRLLAGAEPSEWFKHLHPPQSANGPNVLALSGGGEDGAFGAGALVGWSKTGQKPKFDMVTGISIGALIAPFAFLGQDYDDALIQLFTEFDASNIMRLRPLQAVFGDSLYDTTPLAKLIEDFTPDAVLEEIANRHAAGGRLFIVTSEVDMARASIWNMGAIAQAKQYDLFRDVMRASAALPGLFPPVDLHYASGGKTYQETHYDGGVHMQVYAIPRFAFTSQDQKLAGGHVYLLINNTLSPAPTNTSRTALGISQQALTTMGRASALASVNAMQLFALENDLALSVASIDPDSGIVFDPSERFSPDYMNALFKHGYKRALDQMLWDEK